MVRRRELREVGSGQFFGFFVSQIMPSIRSIIDELLRESGKPMLDGFGSGTRLREDLGLNSLELAILTVRIEAVYQVDVFERGLVATVGEVVERIVEKNPAMAVERL
jgi:acyl carrier protein